MATETSSRVEITATPSAGQNVFHNNTLYTTVREGSAFILVPPNAQTSVDPLRPLAQDGSEAQKVFYNPVQQFNRDLSVLAIKAFGEDMCQRKFELHDKFSAKKVKKAERKRQRREQAQNQENGGAGTERGDLTETGEAGASIAGAEASTGASNADEMAYVESAGAQRKRKRPSDKQDDDTEEGAPEARRTDETADLHENVSADAAGKVNGRKRSRDETQENDDDDSDEGPAKIRRVGDGSHEAAAGSESGINATATATTPTTNGNEALNDGNAPQPQPNGQQNQNPKPDWKPRFRILDALSASGLRALRYASEIPFATEVVANDREKNAVKSINMNVQHNKLDSSIKSNHGDALGHMYSVAFPPTNSHGPNHISGKYDVVDLDPYGTAAPFIDAALQALEDGGMLCVTSTDSGVFASCGYSEKTFALYGGMPIKGLHSHEGGLRLLLHSIATTASRHGLAIEPLLSLSIDFYVRLFIRVRKSPADVKFLAGKTMLVYDCDHGCGAWTTQPIGRHQKYKNSDTNWKYSIAQAPNTDQLCQHCGSKTHLAGPMWGGPLHNPAFIEKMLEDLRYADPEIYQTKPRVEGMLDTALDELVVFSDTMDLREGPLQAKGKKETRDLIPRVPPEAIDHHPFFFIPSALCKVIKAVAPPEHLVKGALRHAGFRATRSHCRPGSIKTDAPWSAIWEIMREWVRQKSPIKEGALKEGMAGWKIIQNMRKEPPTSPPAENLEETVDEQGATNGDGGTEGADSVTEKRIKVVFDAALGKDKPGKRMVRYQENPKEHWGPMRRARGAA